MKTLFALVLTLVSSSAFAHGLPEGIYSGSVFNATPMDDLCQLTSATVTINDTGNGTYQLIAQENGFWQYPMSGTCGREFYGTLSPVEGAEHTWDVSFMTGADLINGRAVLEGGKVSITAYYTGIQSNRSLELQMDFNGDQMNYSRRIERIGRMSLLATGTLYK